MANQLWVKKPIDKLLKESTGEGNQLKRTLGPGSLVALGVGAIIGAGLFSITGGAAAESGRSCHHNFIYGCGIGLRLCRSVLCRICFNDTCCR